VLFKIVPEYNGDFKNSIRKQLDEIVSDAINRETLELARLINRDCQKAVDELVEENRHAINGIVEEAKKLIQSKAQLSVTIDALKMEFRDDLVMKLNFPDAKN
jgi:predicted translin family RNA/ssDNA-binding protein